MSDPITRNFNNAIQKSFEWLKDVEAGLETDDRQDAYHAFRGVLHALRDRLVPEEAADLASGLPELLRGVYYEGWSPAHKPEKMNREEFLDRIRMETKNAPGNLDPELCANAVFGVLLERIGDGEISHVKGALPDTFENLWPVT